MHACIHSCCSYSVLFSLQAIDKYFKVEVTVNAPVVLLPVSEVSDQCFMIDMGSLAVQNTLLIPDKSQVRVGIDAYGIKLESFKVSRYVKNLQFTFMLYNGKLQ